MKERRPGAGRFAGMTQKTRTPRRRAAIAALASTIFAASPALADFNDAPANAPDQTPAFEGQTRAPVLADDIALETTVIAEGLSNPWGMDQLPDGSWLVTEKPGNLRLIAADGTMGEPITGVPAVDNRDQGGLLDVLAAPDFDSSRRIWISYSKPFEGGDNATAVSTATLSDDGTALQDVQEIWVQQPATSSTKHFGSRLVLDNDGGLFITTGERSDAEFRGMSQDVNTTLGKVVRVDPMTGAPMGGGAEGGLPEIWSWGHRNLQSAALAPDGTLWTVEHGPRGGDELNHPQLGKNYGWPEVTYGVEYSGAVIGNGETARDGIEQPVYYWDPVIAPSGLAFYDGEMFPEWQGNALIGGLGGKALVRLQIDGERVTGEARHLQGIGRVRDVDIAPDGSVMILTDDANGALIRVSRGQ